MEHFRIYQLEIDIIINLHTTWLVIEKNEINNSK